MSIGAFDDILGKDEEEEFEELEEIDIMELEELFEKTVEDDLKRIRKKNKKVWHPKRNLNG